MRRIKIIKWKGIDKDGREIEEDLLTALNAIVSNSSDFPRGLENFYMYFRISKAFEKAKQTGILELEESDYKFLRDKVEKEIPAVWALNTNIKKAIDEFLNAKPHT